MEAFTQEQLAFFMQKALELSEKAVGKTGDNPPVGCVIVENQKIIAAGFTNPPGQPHAEAQALQEIPQKNLEQATCFVTLEPCSFEGRTPSCAKNLVERKIGRVIVGIIDPHPKNKGAGIKILKEAKIEVHLGILQEKIEHFLLPFLTKE